MEFMTAREAAENGRYPYDLFKGTVSRDGLNL